MSEQSHMTPASTEAQLAMVEAILEAVTDAAAGKPTSDFMESFYIVRRVLELVAELATVKAELDGLKSWVAESMKQASVELVNLRASLAQAEAQLTEAERAQQALRAAAKTALTEMCNTVAPRNSFTDAVDALSAALTEAPSEK